MRVRNEKPPCSYLNLILSLSLSLSLSLTLPMQPAQAELNASPVTKVVMLGTGTPFADPKRSGPGVAILVNNTPYLVDFGPGIVRRAAAMTPAYGGNLAALEPKRLTRAFLTHLHSDHTTGYPDLIFTPWTLGRDEPLQVYGPEGIEEMTRHILKAYGEDIRYRVYGLEPTNNLGWRVKAYPVKQGLVYEDDNVSVEAFRVRHGSWPNAFGYRFTTPDRVIVISGDAAPGGDIEAYAEGADILIHEVYAASGLARRTAFWKRYHSSNHTSGVELGELAEQVKPKLLVLYHVLFFGASKQDILNEVRTHYTGDVVLPDDLAVF